MGDVEMNPKVGSYRPEVNRKTAFLSRAIRPVSVSKPDARR